METQQNNNQNQQQGNQPQPDRTDNEQLQKAPGKAGLQNREEQQDNTKTANAAGNTQPNTQGADGGQGGYSSEPEKQETKKKNRKVCSRNVTWTM